MVAELWFLEEGFSKKSIMKFYIKLNYEPLTVSFPAAYAAGN